MSEVKTTVLVVGGGLSGLSTAAFLAWHNVPCLVVERHADLLIHPRLRGVTARTMEIYRQLGIEDGIRAASGIAGDSGYQSLRAQNLASTEFMPMGTVSEDQFAAVSPSPWGSIDQDKLEVLLRDRARALGADIRFGVRMTKFTTGADGVTAVIKDLQSGAETAVRADFLVGADGNSSSIRAQLGIETYGPGLFGEGTALLFEADLSPALGDRKVGVAYLGEPVPGTVLVYTGGDRWTLGLPLIIGDTQEELDRKSIEAIRAATGLPDLEVRLLEQVPGTGIKQLSVWTGAQVAGSFSKDRVFLVGDAAHIVPPVLGMGGSIGVQDTHNLAWKIAAVHRGYAGEELLESYDAERRPVAAYSMQQILAVGAARGAMGGKPQPPPADFDLSALVFGYQYRSAAVAGTDGDPVPAVPAAQLAAQPGTRAPHAPVRHQGAKMSTLDLYGKSFVLLAGPELNVSEAREVADARSLPLDVYRIGTDVTPVDQGTDLAAIHGISSTGAVLVRPDGFVAWRATETGGPEGEFHQALREVLPARPV